jgi:hypothetical protein
MSLVTRREPARLVEERERLEMPSLSPFVPTNDRAATTRVSELDAVEKAIRSIKHGEVRVIIQDGKVVQIERREKLRLW